MKVSTFFLGGIDMKRFHEVALVKDGNKHVGFLLKDGRTYEVVPYFYVTKEEFEKLVKENQVQYLVWDNGLKIKYSDFENEELRNLQMFRYPVSLKDYYKSEVHNTSIKWQIGIY